MASAFPGTGVVGGSRSRGEGRPRVKVGVCARLVWPAEACSWGLAPLKVNGAVSSFVRVNGESLTLSEGQQA